MSKKTNKLTERLQGKRILSVTMNRSSNGRGGWADQPVIHLEGGEEIHFTTQETEFGWYGTHISVRKGG